MQLYNYQALPGIGMSPAVRYNTDKVNKYEVRMIGKNHLAVVEPIDICEEFPCPPSPYRYPEKYLPGPGLPLIKNNGKYYLKLFAFWYNISYWDHFSMTFYCFDKF